MILDKQARKCLNKIEERIKHPNKKVSKQCVVCGSKMVKDFIDDEYDFVCRECLDEMKDFTNDFNEPLPKWIIMDPELVRKTLIMKYYKHDFPERYEQIKRDFINRYCGE